MVIDIIVAAIVFVWAVFGYRKGFIRQAFALAGVILMMFFAAPLANILSALINNEFGIPLNSYHAKIGLLAASSCLIYLICIGIGKFLHDTLVKGISMAEKTNHVLGMILGILESTVAIYFVLCILLIHIDRIGSYAPAFAQTVSESHCGKVVANNNLVEQFELFSGNEKLEINIKPVERPGIMDKSDKTESPEEPAVDQKPKDSPEQDNIESPNQDSDVVYKKRQ